MVGTQTTEEAVVLRVAHNIGVRRRALGLTQAQLAERLGVDTETLSRFERGKHAPTLKNLIRLAGLLQTTVTDLLDESEKKPEDEALVLMAWLAPLSPRERTFAKSVLKQCCDYLAEGQPEELQTASGAGVSLTVEGVRKALNCPVTELEANIDTVLVLLLSGLQVKVTGEGKEYASIDAEHAYFLYCLVPALRAKVVAAFPDREETWMLQPALKTYWVDTPIPAIRSLTPPKLSAKQEKQKRLERMRMQRAGASSTEKSAVIEFITDDDHLEPEPDEKE